MRGTVYLDGLASSPLDPRIAAAMAPWWRSGAAANPASDHAAGRAAAAAIARAREQIAGLIGAAPSEIVFTSGATEANNLALFGLSAPGGRILSTAIEHASVLACLPVLVEAGRDARIVDVDRHGRIDPAAFSGGANTLVSVGFANNEIGTIQELGAIEAARLHSDAAQGPAWGAIDVRALGLVALSLSAHKMHGPQGIGALYVRRDQALAPRALGGGQQGGRRSGTLPVALIVGFGEAAALAAAEGPADAKRVRGLADRLVAGLTDFWPTAYRNGAEPRLPGCVSLTLPGIDAADLLLDLPDLALSTGSACATGAPGPSHVLRAIGLDDGDAHATFRFGLGRFSTADDIELAINRFREVLRAKARPAPPGSPADSAPA